MKTATVRDLRNHFSRLLAWIAAGEETTLTQRGKPVARLSPAPASAGLEKVDWNQSAAVARDREIRLSACKSSELLMEAGGKW
jgi:hypothetical protein